MNGVSHDAFKLKSGLSIVAKIFQISYPYNIIIIIVVNWINGSSCNINSLNRFFICIYFKNTTDLRCVIKNLFSVSNMKTHVPQYLAHFLYLATLSFFYNSFNSLRLLYRLLKVVFAIRLARTLLMCQ
jgi:hypothetical protein